jgi:HEAT repeat protein
MLRKPRTFALVLLVTLAVAAQESRNSAAQPRPTEAPSPSASAARSAESSLPPSVIRATMAEKIKDLGSHDPQRVAAAAYWLGELGRVAASAVPQLTAVLADDRSVDPARYRKHAAHTPRSETTSPGEEAAAALAKIGEPAVEALINVLKANPSPFARQNAAWALGMIQGHRSTGAVAALEMKTGIAD